METTLFISGAHGTTVSAFVLFIQTKNKKLHKQDNERNDVYIRIGDTKKKDFTYIVTCIYSMSKSVFGIDCKYLYKEPQIVIPVFLV